MLGAHRTAFQPKLKKTPIEDSLDKIIINSQIKMKEFVLKKTEIEEDTNLLIGKNGVLDESIDFLLNEIKQKNTTLDTLSEKFKQTEGEMALIDDKIKKTLKQGMEKEAIYKREINSMNAKLNTIKNGTIREASNQKFEVKKKCEELLREKYDNAVLADRLYRLNRELYEYEIAYQDSNVNEHTNAIKAENGVQMINHLYQ